MLHAVVIDPSASVRGLVADTFRQLDAQVQEFSSATLVTSQIERANPSLLLIDFDVLRTASREAVHTLLRRLPDMSVLLLVAAGAPGAAFAEWLTVGSTDFLAKPFDQTQLLHRVRQLGALRRVRDIPQQTSQIVLSPLQKLHEADNGRLNAASVADFMGIPLKALAETLGRPYGGVHKTPDAPALQPALTELRRILELTLELTGNEAAVRAWLNTPRPDFSGETPLSVIRGGAATNVRDFLEIVVAGGPT